MKVKQDPEGYQAREAAFLENLARSVKLCIDQSHIASPQERERLFGSLLPLIAARVSGYSGGRPYPVIAFSDGDAICFGNGSRLHELAGTVAETLAGFKGKQFVLDGSQFSTLESFYDEIGKVLIPGAAWGRNLDAFNDILRGGFGTPDEGFVLHWSQSAISRATLGYPETVRQLEARLGRCHPSNRADVAEKLAMAKNGKGETVFDWLIQIIEDHGPGGGQAADNVHLILD